MWFIVVLGVSTSQKNDGITKNPTPDDKLNLVDHGVQHANMCTNIMV